MNPDPTHQAVSTGYGVVVTSHVPLTLFQRIVLGHGFDGDTSITLGKLCDRLNRYKPGTWIGTVRKAVMGLNQEWCGLVHVHVRDDGNDLYELTPQGRAAVKAMRPEFVE